LPENGSPSSMSLAAGVTTEFTGERVIPGQVDVNLWNEHKARYAFAARLSRHKRVLDLGCGSGYGTSDLSQFAYFVVGADVAREALEYSTHAYKAPNITWSQASAVALPFRDASFDLVVGFEVIEHLSNWREMLSEVRRVLRPGGQFIVSTPNKDYYAESRRLAGPNPFHEHEFEFREFEAALAEVFPHASFFLEDHTEGILFQAITNSRGAEVRLDGKDPDAATANFFVAVCAMTPQTGSPTFVYLPEGGNIVRERELHIRRLEDELRTKNDWLDSARREHAELVELFRKQTAELQERNLWAQKLSEELIAAGERIVQVQNELADVTQGYQTRVSELEEENRRTEDVGKRLAAELADKCTELGTAVEFLHEAETTVEERTNWALQLQAERDQLEAKLNLVEASRWIRLGRAIGVGPRVRER